MKIGICGVGFVGGATHEVLKPYHEIYLYDKYKDVGSIYEMVREAEVIFVCVPTPMKKSGECDVSIVKEAVDNLVERAKELKLKRRLIIVIRSTMPAGFTKGLETKYSNLFHYPKSQYPTISFAMNPEFLREKHAVEDLRNADRIIIGTEEKAVFELVERVFLIADFTCTIIYVDLTTAELIKSFNNAFLALKVSFANEMYNIAQLLGVNYDKLAECVALDKRFGPGKCDVPGPNGDLGFGGSCLPKDLRALIYRVKELGYIPYLLSEIWRTNLRWRTKKNW